VLNSIVPPLDVQSNISSNSVLVGDKSLAKCPTGKAAYLKLTILLNALLLVVWFVVGFPKPLDDQLAVKPKPLTVLVAVIILLLGASLVGETDVLVHPLLVVPAVAYQSISPVTPFSIVEVDVLVVPVLVAYELYPALSKVHVVLIAGLAALPLVKLVFEALPESTLIFDPSAN